MLSANSLFVADLPKETTYEDLSSFFANYHFQYAALNNNRPSSIWAKVCLETEEWANKAKHDLNGKLLYPKASQSHVGKPVRICTYDVSSSKNPVKNIKQSLLIKNLDSKMSQREFYEIFSSFGEIDSAKIEYDEQGISKGFGYIYYSDETSAEKAKESLNKKEYYGKCLDIVNLIPFKSMNVINNTLFVLNFPLDFTEEDLKKLFIKYGDITYVSISKDQKGMNRGTGLVTFDKPESSSKCIADIKKNQLAFPGLPPLTVKYYSTKTFREKKNQFAVQNNYDLLKMQFSLYYPTSEIETEADLDKEIRLFIKVVMLQEYTPQDVLVDLNALSGIVTFDNRKSFDLYLSKYKEFCMTRMPSFECFPVVPIKEEETQPPMQNEVIINNTPLPPKPNNIQTQFPINPTTNYYIQQQQPFPQQKPVTPVLGNFPSQTMPTPNGRVFPNMFLMPYPEQMLPQPRPPRNMLRVNDNIKPNGKPPMMPMPMAFPPHNIFMRQMLQMGMLYEMRRNALQFQMNQMANANINNNKGNEQMGMGNIKGNENEMNLQNMNQQYHSNEPEQQVFNNLYEEEDEDMLNEIAETIFEIVSERYPDEAPKITGMIKEKGLQTMKMLLSKKDDLYKMIEQAYEMIKESEK